MGRLWLFKEQGERYAVSEKPYRQRGGGVTSRWALQTFGPEGLQDHIHLKHDETPNINIPNTTPQETLTP